MHGPEHHFLVPAVLLASYVNRTGITKNVAEDKIRQANPYLKGRGLYVSSPFKGEAGRGMG